MEELELLASELAIGESRNGLVCPFCNGGSSGERTFNVTLTDEGLKYKCHRASCSKQGCAARFRDFGAGTRTRRLRNENHTRALSTPVLERLPERLQSSLLDSYGLTEQHCERAGLRWASELNRLWIPVINHDGSHSGAQARSLDASIVPKTLTFKDSDTSPGKSGFKPIGGWVGMSYYPIRKQGLVLVVEDCFSAIRASEYIDSVALLGTHLGWEKLEDILEVYDGIILALDQDAISKAVEYEKRFSPFCHIYILALERDIKNLTEDELKAKLSDYI